MIKYSAIGLTIALLGVSGVASAYSAPVPTWYTVNQSYNTNGWYPAAATNGVGAGDEVEFHVGAGNNAPVNTVWSDQGVWANEPSGGQELSFYTGSSIASAGGNLSLAGDATSGSPNRDTFIGMVGFDPNPVGDCQLPEIWIQTGTYAGSGDIAWNSPFVYISASYGNNGCEWASGGWSPTVAQANGVVVEMHNIQPDSDIYGPGPQLYYNVGTVSGTSVSLSTSNIKTFQTTGYHPSIAIWSIPGTSDFVVIEVHEQGNGPGNLETTSGHLTMSGGTGTIVWGATQTYQSGFLPQIAICAENGTLGGTLGTASVVEFHNGGTGKLWYLMDRIIGSDAGPYHGVNSTNNEPLNNSPTGGEISGVTAMQGTPSVACANAYGYEVHTNNGAGNLTRTTFTVN